MKKHGYIELLPTLTEVPKDKYRVIAQSSFPEIVQHTY